MADVRRGAYKKNKRSLLRFLFFVFLFPSYICHLTSSFADDCLSYKVSPDIEISVPMWSRVIVQPEMQMDLLHGRVAASMVEEYSLSVLAEPVPNGYCIVLTGINATVGYTEFVVQIDSRHRFGTCGYDITLEHEDKHIDAHLSTAKDADKDIKRSIRAAANAIMPIFVKDGDDIDAAMDQMQAAIQNHPDIILMKQKIDADQEIRNKKVDQRDDSHKINKCLGL